MGTLLDAAINYAERGIPVVPLHHVQRIPRTRCSCSRGPDCKSPGKHPLFISWQIAATTDFDRLAFWWQRHPNANVGITMGGPQHLIALDIDGDRGRETLRAIEDRFTQLPETLTQTTGRLQGGEHRIFRIDDNDLSVRALTSHVNTFGTGIDIRAEGTLLVAAPSEHVTGARYAWRNEVPIQEIPRWLVPPPVISTTTAASLADYAGHPLADRIHRARRYLLKLPPAVQGHNGSGALMRVAIILTRGFALPVEIAQEILWSDFNPRCKPPWSLSEIRHKVDDAHFNSYMSRGYLLERVEDGPTPT